MTKANKRLLGTCASIATILALCVGVIALIPPFAQLFISRPPQPIANQSLPPAATEFIPTAIQQVQMQNPVTSNDSPTAVVLPTNPLPTPTDIVFKPAQKPNTPQGKELAVGETWVKDGFGVTLTKVEPGIPGTRFHFIFENTTQSDTYFQFDTGAITVTDSNGNVYSHSRKCKTNISLAAGETASWITTYCPGGDEFQEDFYNSSVKYYIVTINNMGPIDQAVWRVPKP
jgi:hypothetical protein